nr:putative eg45-like domain containing protein 1 [Quercus suber]
MKMRAFLMVGIIAILTSTATAIPGIATFYTQYVPSACYGNQSQGVMVAAASDTFWSGGAACGKYYNVRCTRDHNVTVKIVDHCPDCSSTIDLSREAFAKIAKPMAGIVIDIDYHQVEVTQRLE